MRREAAGLEHTVKIDLDPAAGALIGAVHDEGIVWMQVVVVEGEEGSDC